MDAALEPECLLCNGACTHPDDEAVAGTGVCCGGEVMAWLIEAGLAVRHGNGDVSHKPGLCPEDEEG